jgi:hypothetical protein
MGHADLSNISTFVRDRLRRRGSASIKELADDFAARYPDDGVRASEGVLTDDYMLREAIGNVIGFWLGRDASMYEPPATWAKKPIVVTGGRVSKAQRRVLGQWLRHATDDWDSDDPHSGYVLFDSIRWRFSRHWRGRQIPLLGRVTS